MTFQAGEMYARDETGIPTGARAVPTPGPWDDCFTNLTELPRLSWPNGLVVELHASCEHWVVYSEPGHAVCIEPQSGPPDAFNLGECELVSPNQPVCHTFRMQWRQA